MGKRRYINFKVDEDISEAVALPSVGPVRESWRVRCGRCMRFTGFCLVCTGTLFQAVAPWVLSVVEVSSLLLILLLLTRRTPGPFQFQSSLEDVVLLGGLRAAALSATYAWGSKHSRLRPYLLTSYVTGVTGFSYVLVKAFCFQYVQPWIPSAALMATFALFSCMHILAARHLVSWARRRGQLGLAPLEGLGTLRYSSSAASPAGPSASSSPVGRPTPQWMQGDDVPAELLADPDSQFIDVGGIVIHYKQAFPPPEQYPGSQWPQDSSSTSTPLPSGASKPGSEEKEPSCTAAADIADGRCGGSLTGGLDAIVLVHGFGGGVFSWRHVMQPLADASGVRVVALDRPGFGLTSRPPVLEDSARDRQPSQQQKQEQQEQQQQQPLLDPEQQGEIWQQRGEGNPYTVQAQATLVMRFCEALGLRRVVLMGHADGCLVVLHAAAALAMAHADSEQIAALRNGNGAPQSSPFAQQETHTAAQQQQQQHQEVQRVMSVVQPTTSSDAVPRVSDSTQESTAEAEPPLEQGHSSRESRRQRVASGSNLSESEPTGLASPASSISLSSMLAAANTDAQPQQPQQQLDLYKSSSLTLRPPSSLQASRSSDSSSGQQLEEPFGSKRTRSSRLGWSHSDGGSSSSSYSMRLRSLVPCADPCSVNVCGVVLCAPHLPSHHIQPFTRLLATSSLGRNIIRPLLRTQVGDVRSRWSWYCSDLITPELLQLYRAPLHVEGWDTALLACSKATAAIDSKKVEQQLRIIRHIPALVLTGEADRIAPTAKAYTLVTLLHNCQLSIIPRCGHLLHEEAPAQLVQRVHSFLISGTLQPAGAY